MHPIAFGRNPFYGLPFHGFFYDTRIGGLWDAGIPHLLMQSQDIVNIAYTWMMRMMMAGTGKIMFEDGTIEKPNEMLDNRLDKPLVWKRLTAISQPPQRLAPPQMNQAAADIISSMPEWMDDMLNMSEVQRGIASKRGESAEALKVKLSEANVPLEDLRRDDEITLQDMLYSTLVDISNPLITRADQLKSLLGNDIPQEHILMLLREPVTRNISSILVHSSTLRPKTPPENRDELVSMVGAQLLDADKAKWEMDRRGVGIDTLLTSSRQKQLTEIDMIIRGIDVQVAMAEAHEYHRKTISEFVESRQWLTLDPEAKERIQMHDAEHMQAQIARARTEAMAAMQSQYPQQGSPPAEAVSMAAGTPSGSVGSAINVA
jgi:hypothetical protein